MFGQLKKQEEKTNVNVKMPKYIRDMAQELAKEETAKSGIRISESEIYRRIVTDFFSRHRI